MSPSIMSFLPHGHLLVSSILPRFLLRSPSVSLIGGIYMLVILILFFPGISIVNHSVISSSSPLRLFRTSFTGRLSLYPIINPPPLFVLSSFFCSLSLLFISYPGSVGVLSSLIIFVSWMAKISIFFSYTILANSSFFDRYASAFH